MSKYDELMNEIIHEEKTLFLNRLIGRNVNYKTIFRLSVSLNKAVKDIEENPTDLYPKKGATK